MEPLWIMDQQGFNGTDCIITSRESNCCTATRSLLLINILCRFSSSAIQTSYLFLTLHNEIKELCIYLLRRERTASNSQAAGGSRTSVLAHAERPDLHHVSIVSIDEASSLLHQFFPILLRLLSGHQPVDMSNDHILHLHSERGGAGNLTGP